MTNLKNVETWIFDLDNTLYPAESNLFAQIDARMTTFIAKALDLPSPQARKLQKDYYAEYGTTLNGLMHEHAIAPEDFLSYVHDIDLSVIDRCEILVSGLERLPGRRLVFTNGSVRHAENVLEKLEIAHFFEEIFDIAAADYLPKPNGETYQRFIRRHAVDPRSAAMFEDQIPNLLAPYEMGMTTILVRSDAAWCDNEPPSKRPAGRTVTADHVHHSVDDLPQFLNGLSHADQPAFGAA